MLLRSPPGPALDFNVEGKSVFKATQSSDATDLRSYCTPSNQYSLNACAGNATADAIEICDAVAGRPVVQLSRLFVYSMSRTLYGNLAKDEGTFIKGCFEVLSRFGLCSEDAWPYLEEKVFVSPSLMAMRDAIGHKIHSYYAITATGQDRLAQVKSALKANAPVVFGTLVTKAFEAWTPDQKPLGIPLDAILGGHAMVIVGYRPETDSFIVKNSWGPGWGDQGFIYLSSEYIAWDQTWDLWVPFAGYNG